MEMKHSEFAPENAVTRATAQPVVVDTTALPLEGWTDTTCGTGRWRTLFCADRTATDNMVLGLADFSAGETLAPHRHQAAEFYLGLSGEAEVTVDGVVHRLTPGVAIYIPGNAEHGVVAGAHGVSFAYGFPTDRFSNVDYQFSGR